MTKRKYFGTDGIRGEANSWPVTSEVALRLGKAVGVVFRNGSGRHKIVIGKDTRLSGYMLETALASGIVSTGCDVMLVGPLPTPGIAFITNGMRGDAGIVISASHNPYIDNGIKLFDRFGYKLEDDVEARLEDFLEDQHHEEFISASAEDVGRAFRVDDAVGRFIVFLKSTFPSDLSLKGLKLVVDCANGACYKTSPAVFYELGAEIVETGIEPDGTNINEGVGALHPRHVAELVKLHRADAGIALDGDGDRVVMVDADGEVIAGDALLGICATDLMEREKLASRKMVATVMSNLGLDRMLEAQGGLVLRADVGDRHVVAMLREHKLNFGGESSGHIIFRDYNTTGDGTLAGLQILARMVRTQKSLSELAASFEAVPQIENSVRVRDKPPLESLAGFENLLNAARDDLGSHGQILVRYSGTENKARVMVQGEQDDVVQSWGSRMQEWLTEQIGA